MSNNQKISQDDEDFWYKVSQNQFTHANALKLDRPETPHLLNLYENSRPLTRGPGTLVDPLLANPHPRFLDASSVSRPGTAFSETTGLNSNDSADKVQVYNLRLQPLQNAPKLPVLEDIQARLKATQERRKIRKSQKNTKVNRQKNGNISEIKEGTAHLDLNKLHDESSGDQNVNSVIYDDTPSSTHFDRLEINNTYKRGNSSGDRRKRSKSRDSATNFSKHSISDSLNNKSSTERKRQAALNDAIEVIQNLKNNYSTAERVRSAQLAMRLSPGSQNSYAISKILFQFSQNDIHLLASPIIVKDLLAFLAVCGSKSMKKYHQSILYILGTIRSISSSWKTASNKIDMEDLCDEILEYVSLVMEVVLNIDLETETSSSSIEPEYIQKILIQSTGLIRNTTERMNNSISNFQYHETFSCLFIILRRYYKNNNLVLNIVRIFSTLDMEKMLQIVPEIQNYFNFLVFSLQEKELSESDQRASTPSKNTSRFKLLNQRPNSSGSTMSNCSTIDQVKSDHFTIKIIYLLGNLAEYTGAGLEFETIGKQILNLVISYLKMALFSIREMSSSEKTCNSKKELSTNCFRLLGNLSMEEQYLKSMVNNKELVTLIRIYLNSDIGLDDLLLGVIHNISSFELSIEKEAQLPVFFKMVIDDLLMSEGTVFRNACEENRIVCMAILANVSKHVTNAEQIACLVMIACRGLCSESSQTVYMCLGILSNLSNNGVLFVNNGVLAAILGTLEDFLQIDIIFVYLSCKILKSLFLPNTSSYKDLDSTIVVNLISVLQDITDEDASIEILNLLLKGQEKCSEDGQKQIVLQWNQQVVPMSEEILSVIGDKL